MNDQHAAAERHRSKTRRTSSKYWFSPELRTASVVPRWSIVWTLTRDTLSNHSFFVALYSDQIAEMIGWEGPRDTLMFMALVHDLDETITGDIVAPAKRAILDNDKSAEYIRQNMLVRLPYVVERLTKARAWNPDRFDEAQLIVKAADRLDALIFLTVEKRLGNSVIAPRIPECWSSLREAWLKLPCPSRGEVEVSRWPVEVETLFLKYVVPAVEAHETTGGYGI